jgi:hypothetical protein
VPNSCLWYPELGKPRYEDRVRPRSDHGINRELRLAWLCNEWRSTGLYDSVLGLRLLHENNPLGVTVDGQTGIQYVAGSSQRSYGIADRPYYNTYGSYAFRVRVDVNDWATIFSYGSQDSPGLTFAFQIISDGGSLYFGYSLWNGAAYDRWRGGTALTVGKTYDVLYTFYHYGSPFQKYLWVDGQAESITTINSGIGSHANHLFSYVTDSNPRMSFAWTPIPGGSAYYYSITILRALMWTRMLGQYSYYEIQSERLRPWGDYANPRWMTGDSIYSMPSPGIIRGDFWPIFSRYLE